MSDVGSGVTEKVAVSGSMAVAASTLLEMGFGTCVDELAFFDKLIDK